MTNHLAKYFCNYILDIKWSRIAIQDCSSSTHKCTKERLTIKPLPLNLNYCWCRLCETMRTIYKFFLNWSVHTQSSKTSEILQAAATSSHLAWTHPCFCGPSFICYIKVLSRLDCLLHFFLHFFPTFLIYLWNVMKSWTCLSPDTYRLNHIII